MKAIKKAIIPAAGLGTRFLPATKAQPKEMLPIVDKPTIQYIVEEAIASGIEDILIVTGRGKRAIEDHFDKSFELEATLDKGDKVELLEMVSEISNLVDIHYVRQKEAKGLGHAIWCARKFIGNEPFAVLLGDDLVTSLTPCLRQLMQAYSLYQSPIIGVQKVPDSELSQYGVIDILDINNRCIKVADLVEKPERHLAPSNYGIMGRYILTPEIFEVLETQQPGKGGEIQLTDALRTLNSSQPIIAYEFEGKRYDVGSKQGYLEATVEFALGREDLRDDFEEYLVKLLEERQKAKATLKIC